MEALTKEALVHWRVVVERADPTGSVQRCVIADIERSGMPRESEVGMSHDEGKVVLHALQSLIVTDQAREFARAARQCMGCGRPRVLKEHRYRHLDTLFGRVVVPAPRFERCRCGHASQASPVSALLPHRTTPGLRHLQAKLSALMPYRRAADVLDTFLPPLSSLNYSTTRNRVLRVGQAIEDELQDCIEHERTTAGPVESMVVGIDGAFVKAVPTETRRKDLEVVVGRIEVSGRPRELFAVVREPGGQARERLRATLRRAGRGPATRQDEMRELPGRWLGAEQRYRLDWFHLRRRIERIGKVLYYLPRIGSEDFHDRVRVYYRDLRRVKWRLWARATRHGPWMIALSQFASHLLVHRNEALSAGISVERIDDVLDRLDELRRYVLLNQRSLVDYGRVWRAGERVSTAHIESTVNQLVSYRMCKKQQMRWSRPGAQLVLHVRTALLNGRLESYTGLRVPSTCAVVNDNTMSLAA